MLAAPEIEGGDYPTAAHLSPAQGGSMLRRGRIQKVGDGSQKAVEDVNGHIVRRTLFSEDADRCKTPLLHTDTYGRAPSDCFETLFTMNSAGTKS